MKVSPVVSALRARRLWMSVESVLLAVGVVLHRIQHGPSLTFFGFHVFSPSDLGHYWLPEWRNRDKFWSATLLHNFNI